MIKNLHKMCQLLLDDLAECLPKFKVSPLQLDSTQFIMLTIVIRSTLLSL
jgi:hypothetical protein